MFQYLLEEKSKDGVNKCQHTTLEKSAEAELIVGPSVDVARCLTAGSVC